MLSLTPPRLAIIGNGLACQRLLQELVERQANYRIDVYSDETVPGYNRIQLSSLLSGAINESALTSLDAQWYRQHNITLHLQTRVTAIDSRKHQLTLNHCTMAHYDKLIIATGSRAVLPPIAHDAPSGVVSFRTLADTHYLMSRAQDCRRAVVAGGGLLGIEAATGLANRGLQVTLLQRDAHLMNRQLDPAAAKFLETALAQRGIRVITEREILALSGEHQLTGVTLNSGQHLGCDLLVFAIGIRPCIIPGSEQMIPCQRGYLVNDQLATPVKDIYALGECVELNGNTFGLVAPIWQQAMVLASNLCGQVAHFQETASVTQLKVSGLQVHSMGDLSEHPQNESLVFEDSQRGIYKRLVVRGMRLVGALLVGDVADSAWYFQLLESQQSIQAWRHLLAFGRAFCQPATAAFSTQPQLDSAA